MTSKETAGPTSAGAAPAPASAAAAPATFRAVPLPALVGVGFVAIAVSPIGFLGGAWSLFFLLPLALAWWVVRTRTVVDGAALRVVSAWGSLRIGWDEVATLRVVDRGWVRAVRSDGSDGSDGPETPLVGVRARDLGRLARASGGRITMPTPEEVEDAREHQRELEATRLRIARLRELQADAAEREAAEREAAEREAAEREAEAAGTEAGDAAAEADRPAPRADQSGDRSADTDAERQRRHFADTPPGEERT